MATRLRKILAVYIGYAVPLKCPIFFWHIRQFFTAQCWNDGFFVIQSRCNYARLFIAGQVGADSDFFDVFAMNIKWFSHTSSLVTFRPCSFVCIRFRYSTPLPSGKIMRLCRLLFTFGDNVCSSFLFNRTAGFRQILIVYIGCAVPLICSTGVLWHQRQFFAAQYRNDGFFIIQSRCNYARLFFTGRIDTNPNFFDIFTLNFLWFSYIGLGIISGPLPSICMGFSYCCP